MHLFSKVRLAASVAALSGAALLALAHMAPPAQGQANFLNNGEAGFVVASFEYALAAEGADRSEACPAGITEGPNLDTLLGGGGGQRPAQGGAARPNQQVIAERMTSCANPAQAPQDPDFHTIASDRVPALGIDLDGQVSRANGRAAPGTCAHADFSGAHGERGIDNQFLRVVGCTRGFQREHGVNMGSETTEMLTGSWGILLRLRGVDDIRNDDNVEVSFYANSDPIQLSGSREPLVNVTYAAVADPRLRATARGRIANGVLTSEPVDVRFLKTINSIYIDRPLREARVRMTLSADGVLEGYLAGYTNVEDMYDFQYGYHSARNVSGAASPREGSITAIGASLVGGYTCNGAYHALVAAADGHPDPATGRCTSISTQYYLRAVPAFVAD